MKNLDKLKVILFVLAIFIFPILTVTNSAEGNNYIESENRYKAKLNLPTKETIINGKFWTEFEEFFNDRFKYRQELLEAKTFVDMNIAGKYKFSDSILSNNKEMMFRYRSNNGNLDKDKVGNDLKHWRQINDYLKAKHTPIIVVGIPDQSHIFADNYPTWAYNQLNHYQEMREYFFNGLKDLNIDFIDFDPIARENREHYYYKTDHHPNFNATLKIYDELINRISENYFPIKNLNNGDIELVENPNRFIGSHNRKVFGIIDENTHAIYAQPKKDIPFKRYDSGNLSNLGIINPNSKFYATYMYGDNPYTIIDTNRKELPNIMIIGDSTTNALESIMWMNANKLTSIDFRHYKEKNIIEFLEENPQDIIILSIISGYYENLLRIMK